jgi:hypothetical protein
MLGIDFDQKRLGFPHLAQLCHMLTSRFQYFKKIGSPSDFQSFKEFLFVKSFIFTPLSHLSNTVSKFSVEVRGGIH